MRRLTAAMAIGALLCASAPALAETTEQRSPNLITLLLGTGLVIASTPFTVLGTVSCGLYDWRASCVPEVADRITGNAVRLMLNRPTKSAD